MDILAEYRNGGRASDVPGPLPAVEGVLDGAVATAACYCPEKDWGRAADRPVRQPRVRPETGPGAVADLDGHRGPEHMVDLAFRLRRQQRPNRVRLGSTQPLPAKPQSKAEHPQVRQAQAAEVLPINLYVAASIIEVY